MFLCLAAVYPVQLQRSRLKITVWLPNQAFILLQYIIARNLRRKSEKVLQIYNIA